jgi:uncharacterized protein with ACT and thioredoxin-like domain
MAAAVRDRNGTHYLLIFFNNQLNAQYFFTIIYFKITNCNIFHSLQNRNQGVQAIHEVTLYETTSKIVVNICILISGTSRSRSEGEMPAVLYETDVNTQRCGTLMLVIQCL